MATMPPRGRTTAVRRHLRHGLYAALVWLGRRRRLVAGLVSGGDRRHHRAGCAGIQLHGHAGWPLGGSQTAVAIALAVAAYRAIAQAISRNAWRWARPNRSWAMALTSAMALRAKARSRVATAGPIAERPSPQSNPADDDDDAPLDDLAAGLRRLAAYAVTALTLLAIAWIWEVDMALVQFLLNLPVPLWPADARPRSPWAT